MRSKRNVLNNI